MACIFLPLHYSTCQIISLLGGAKLPSKVNRSLPEKISISSFFHNSCNAYVLKICFIYIGSLIFNIAFEEFEQNVAKVTNLAKLFLSIPSVF